MSEQVPESVRPSLADYYKGPRRHPIAAVPVRYLPESFEQLTELVAEIRAGGYELPERATDFLNMVGGSPERDRLVREMPGIADQFGGVLLFTLLTEESPPAV